MQCCSKILCLKRYKVKEILTPKAEQNKGGDVLGIRSQPGNPAAYRMESLCSKGNHQVKAYAAKETINKSELTQM